MTEIIEIYLKAEVDVLKDRLYQFQKMTRENLLSQAFIIESINLGNLQLKEIQVTFSQAPNKMKLTVKINSNNTTMHT